MSDHKQAVLARLRTLLAMAEGIRDGVPQPGLDDSSGICWNMGALTNGPISLFDDAMRAICTRRRVSRWYPIERTEGRYHMPGKWEGRRLTARIRLLRDLINEVEGM